MKSAYELAMERLSKTTPTVKLTEKQKAELAEVESRYAAKMAERELLLQDERRKAAEKGDFEEVEKIEKQLVSYRKTLDAEKEAKKEKVRAGEAD
jgi:hypothetical protein